MEKIKTLVVDDSVIYRTQVKSALEKLAEVEVLATASNGRIAIDRMKLASFDLIILDLEMPEMNGLETLKEIKRLGLKVKVIVFSSVSKRGAEITMEALALGASDFVTKPDGTMNGNPQDIIRSLILPKLRCLFPAAYKLEPKERPEISSVVPFSRVIWDIFKPQIVVIGSSTGGPAALEKIFSKISGPILAPILIAQHMPPLFTATLVERLGKLSGIPAKEASHGEELQNNHIYIAPGNFHLRLAKDSGKIILKLDQDEQINYVRPAVDPLFETASEIFKSKCLGIVLTGMGSDGKTGAQEIKKNGGAIVIQDQNSCVVFGMPGAVHACGAYDRIEDLDSIASMISEKVCVNSMVGKSHV